jgi:hypothetical protein
MEYYAAASIGGFNAEFGEVAVNGGIGHQHRLATDGAVFDVRLLRYR